MIRSLDQYKDPFQSVRDFECMICEYTGAPYAIVTDCCTHAMEISLRIEKNKQVSFPSRTYLSVIMLMHKLDISYELKDMHWRDYYILENTRIWDCARYFKEDMYIKGSIQCLSFGRTKPLEIGRGGCILTDNAEIARRADRMRYDGRDIHAYKYWADQKTFELGFHYYLKPEECIVGMNLLENKKFTLQQDHFFDYPDCRKLKIES